MGSRVAPSSRCRFDPRGPRRPSSLAGRVPDPRLGGRLALRQFECQPRRDGGPLGSVRDLACRPQCAAGAGPRSRAHGRRSAGGDQCRTPRPSRDRPGPGVRRGDPGPPARACPAAAVGATLIEASAAVVRADLVPALAARLDIARVRGSRRWLTPPDPIDSPLARTWHVIRELPDDPRELRAALRERGSATWKTADIDISAEEMSRRIGHRAARYGAAVTVAWVRVDGAPRAYEVTR